MMYRKKSACVEARRCDDANPPAELASWCGGKACGIGDLSAKQWIEIPTLENRAYHPTMRADYGDWIIRDTEGVFYICRSDIFEATYEVVKQSTELPEPTGSSPEEKIKLLRSALIGLIGSSDRKELEGIEAFTRTYMAQGVMPQKDGTGMINAIHALLETEEKL